MVRLSDVRLCARAVGFHRAGDALFVHAGVRRPPPTLQLVHPATGHLPVAADRVRPPESNIHASEQAEAVATGAGRPRDGMGRPAYAYSWWHSPPRIHARGNTKFLWRDWRVEDRKSVRVGKECR